MARGHKRKVVQKPGHQLYLPRSPYTGAKVSWVRLNERTDSLRSSC